MSQAGAQAEARTKGRFAAAFARSSKLLLVAAGLAGLLIGGVAAAAGFQSDLDDERDKVRDLRAGLAETKDEAAAGVREAGAAAREAEQDIGDRRERLNEREAELDERELQLDERQADLDGRQSQLDQRQAELDQRQAAVEASQFGDGLFAVGADIQPGRYHTEGGGGCYWAKLGSSDTSNISDNHFGPGPQTTDINSAFFESNGCGTWTKVG